MMENSLLSKNRKITIILIVISLLILLPSFLLLFASSWNGDDYAIAKLFQDGGFNALIVTNLTWCHRFFATFIWYLYYNAVPWLGKPFTGGMILITWLFLISSVFIFTQNTISKNSLFFQEQKEDLANKKNQNKVENIYLKILLPLLLTLILFIYFLYCYVPAEMYYLVVVSTSYIPTLAGIIFNLNFFINQANAFTISKSNIFQFILFGVITSSSWEMGAIHQLFFSGCIFLLLLFTTFSTKLNYLPFSCLDKFNRWKLSIANLIPFFLSLYVLFLIKFGRFAFLEGVSVGSSVARNFNTSFITAVLQFFRELFFLGHHMDLLSFTYSTVYKLGFLLLLTILFYQVKVKFDLITRNACFISIILLLITNFIITFSGSYQLGISTSGRYMNFKLALMGLIMMIIALIFASLLLSAKKYGDKGKVNIKSVMNSRLILLVCFSLTFTLLINLQFNKLKQDFLNLNNFIMSNNWNWQRNLQSVQSLAIYTQVPTDYIFRMPIEPGLYPSCDRPSNNERSLRYLNYFNKQKLYATPFANKVFTDAEIKNQLDEFTRQVKSLKNEIDFTCSNTPGNVERINQVSNLGQVIEVNIEEAVKISGWVINPDKSTPKRIIITMEDDKDLLVNTTLDIPRPDLTEHFNNPVYINSGWKARFTPAPEWDGKTITFKLWAYNPDTKIANFSQDFTIKFSSKVIY